MVNQLIYFIEFYKYQVKVEFDILTDIPQIFIYLYVYLHFLKRLIGKTFILELNINKFYQ